MYFSNNFPEVSPFGNMTISSKGVSCGTNVKSVMCISCLANYFRNAILFKVSSLSCIQDTGIKRVKEKKMKTFFSTFLAFFIVYSTLLGHKIRINQEIYNCIFLFNNPFDPGTLSKKEKFLIEKLFSLYK